MFKLYYLFDSDNAATSVYSDPELINCINYMEDSGFNKARCLIVSPNGTRITFESNDIVFHSTQTYRTALHAC